MADVEVRAAQKDLRHEQALGARPGIGAARTGADGAYEIPYTTGQLADTHVAASGLVVRAMDADGNVVAAAPVWFNAPQEVTIDLVVSGAVAGQPSEYDRVVLAITPLLADLDPPELTSLEPSDLDFLLGSTKIDRDRLTALLTAVALSRDAEAAGEAVPVSAFYGMLRGGLPVDWASLLLTPAAAITTALVAAAQDGTVPAGLRGDADGIAGQLVACAASRALNPPGSEGPSELGQLLDIAGLSADQQLALLALAASAADGTEELWQRLRAEPAFQDPGIVDRLQFALQLGLLTGNHMPLIRQVLERDQLHSTRDLLTLDDASWYYLLAPPADGQLPTGPPGAAAAPTDQAKAFVQGITGTLRAAFPTETIAGMVPGMAALAPDEQTRLGVARFFANSPNFDIRTTRVSSYAAANAAAVFAGIADEAQREITHAVRRLQRAFQLSVSPETMTALLSSGLDAAHLVANMPRQSFIDRYGDGLGGLEPAGAVHDRATFINSRNLMLISHLNDTVNGVWPRGLTGGSWGNGSPQAQAQLIESYPDYAELFGPLDPCGCEDCRSVLSPAAYLVDLLEFLGGSGTNTEGYTPRDVLIGTSGENGLAGRRPDLAYLALTCENTNTELPYIDLVNEVLESYIAYNGPSGVAAHDTGIATSAQLDAAPQYTLDDPSTPDGHTGPYLTLASAVYPFRLPYNQPIQAARTYLGQLGTSRAEVLETFQASAGPAAAAVDAETLGLDPYLYQLLTGEDLTGGTHAASPTETLYGYAAGAAGWETDLAKLPVFEQRTGITVAELIQILATRFVNPSYPSGADRVFFENIPISYSALATLAAGGFGPATADPAVLAALQTAGISLADLAAWWSRNPRISTVLVIYSPDDSCDIANAAIAHLGDRSPPTGPEYVGLQAFIRLWRALGWAVPDLDRAIAALGAAGLDPGLVHDLARLAKLQQALSPPSLQALLALWRPLDPDSDDSLYAQLFLNPAALPIDPAFRPAPDGAVLPGDEVISAHLPALLAALGISAADLTVICADAGLDGRSPASGSGPGTCTPPPANARLSMDNVSALYRYAFAARALGLSVGDFITLKGLAGPALNPVTTRDAAATPDTTAEFVTLAGAVAQSGFSIRELAYVYRHDSVPPTGLAPQRTTLVVLAQALRAGLAQIAAATAIAADPKGTLTHSVLVQLISKTVADQTVVAVNGTARYIAPVDALPAALARRNGSGQVIGVDPGKTPAGVGAKLGYDPATGNLSYQGAMTAQEHADLLTVPGDASYGSAVAALYVQPATFLADNLAPLLDDPAADATLWQTTPSLDGNLNPVYLDGGGNITQPAGAVTTAIAAKYAYLLGKLLPHLRNALSHSLVKQTIADTFSLDPPVASLLIETILTSPTTPGQPVVADLLNLATAGVTAALYPTGDLSGAAAFTGTLPSVSLDAAAVGSTPRPRTGSARFTSWLTVPASANFTFRIHTNGKPALWVGNSPTPVPLTVDTPGLHSGTAALTAGQFAAIRLDIIDLPASPAGTAALTWQASTIARGTIPAAAQLAGAAFDAFTLAYIRIQKAALLASRFALTAAEISYLQAAGQQSRFAGFDLNALPLAPGGTPAQVAALFESWSRLDAYMTLRNALPAGSVTLIDVFTSATFGAARTLLSQATGWDPGMVDDLLARFLTQSPPDPNPITDEMLPTALLACVKIIHLTGASAGQLFSWAAFSWPDQASAFAGLHAIAKGITNLVSSRYDPVTWLAVAESLSDTLRTSRRDALVAYLMGTLGYTDPDRLFELLLIDPEMGSCMQTSRIRQAINSVQLFVQRCLLGLEQLGATDPTTVDPSQIDRRTWDTWKGQYSLWAANREVFLFPENWLLPQLRDDQTPLMQDFSSALLQGDLTADRAQAVFLDYLKGLDQVGRLDIRAVYRQTGEPDVLHVFARTFHKPYQYFYRQLVSPLGGGTWTPWEPVKADIEGDHLIPVVWEGRLRLIWPVFTQQTVTPPASSTIVTTANGSSTAKAGHPAQNYWKINLSWSEYYQGKWQPKQVSDDFVLSHVYPGLYSPPDILIPFLPIAEQPSQSAHVFTTQVVGDDLLVEMFVQVTDPQTAKITPGPTIPLLGAFRFSSCGDSLVVAYSRLAYLHLGKVEAWPYGIGKSPSQQDDILPSVSVSPEPSTSPYFDGLRQVSGGSKFQLNEPGYPIAITFLTQTLTRFELRYSQQYGAGPGGLYDPFFYADELRTFYVTSETLLSVTAQVASPAAVDLVAMLAATATPVASAGSLRPAVSASSDRLRSNWGQASYLGPVPRDLLPKLTFQTHRHPYVCQFIRALLRRQGTSGAGGIDGLLNIPNQNPPTMFDFSSYGPTNVLSPYPTEVVDFSAGGAYSGYNWELFFHGPLLVALTLSQNQRYEDADTWFRYIFDPNSTDTTAVPPARYWQVQPFRTSATESLLQLMEDIDNNDPGALQQLWAWQAHPFEPFRIARARLAAFQKYVFMRYLDNLIAWGDQLFGQVDTIESINQATQLYILAANLLGPLPERITPPTTPPALCYAQLGAVDQFANIMEMLENDFPYATNVTPDPQADTGGLLGMTKTLLFCIPQNPTLLRYWDTVADRLYKVRHCLNIRGIPQQLALFQGPANPLLAIEGAAQGSDPGSILSDMSAPLPNYRFSYLAGRASELASECQAFGRALLDALEKNDAEGLTLLRATQETGVLTLMHDLKQHQVDEANAAVDALSVSRDVAVGRYNYYQLLLGTANPVTPAVGDTIAAVDVPMQTSQASGGLQLIGEEQNELSLADQAAYVHLGGAFLQIIASALFPIPTVKVDVNVQPAGVGATVGGETGGSNLGNAAEAGAKFAEMTAAYMTYQSWAAGKMGGYFRRQQEWALQSNLASGEIMRIDRDIAAASLRVTIAQDDLAVHDQQTANAQRIQDVLTSKFTSQQLYGWMVDQASGLYSQLYQLAYDTAKLAEVAYQRELAVRDSSYITFGYWDSLRKGLLAGERLKLAVKQLERAYLDGNQREYEITRHVSLLLHDPAALIALKLAGQCVVDLPEELFDLDYPGHYLRRLRDVSLTVPCVAGPYTSINCTLTLLSSKIRCDLTTGTASTAASVYPTYKEKPNEDPRFIYNFAAAQSIATSHAQNDSGLFELSFRDERYLPFETAGAISRWMITMPPACNAFDFETITDVVIKVSYSARYGGDLLRSQAFAAAVMPPATSQSAPSLPSGAPDQTDRRRLFSLRHEFPSEWYGLLHPAASTAGYGQLPIFLSTDRFPFQYRGRKINTGDIEILALLSPGAVLTSLKVDLTPQAAPPDGAPPTAPAPQPGTDQVDLGSLSQYGSAVLYGLKSAKAPTDVPKIWWLSIAKSDLNSVIDKVEDFFVLIHYSVA